MKIFNKIFGKKKKKGRRLPRKSITDSEFMSDIARLSGLSKTEVHKVMGAIEAYTPERVAKGEAKVVWQGLGTTPTARRDIDREGSLCLLSGCFRCGRIRPRS